MRILICGGGTGGHLFPAMAVAEEIASVRPDIEVVFVGTPRGLEARVIPHTQWKLELMSIPAMKGLGLIRKLKTIIFMPISFLKAFSILRKYKPSLVIGVGGYAAGPVTLAAALKRIPTVAMEQNAIPGLTNRTLGRFVKKIFVTFVESMKFFPEGKTILSGNPVRKKVKELAMIQKAKREKFTVLAFGGSQGAKTINDKMVEAVRFLGKDKKEIHLIHQIGRVEDTEKFRAIYAARSVSAEVYNFIEDMGRIYATTDLVICRAGATSIAELTVAGLPAIFIPYPFAADNHQEANAKALVEAGGALMFKDSELTGEKLAQVITELKENPLRLTAMGEAMRKFGKPDAARMIVSESLGLIK